MYRLTSKNNGNSILFPMLYKPYPNGTEYRGVVWTRRSTTKTSANTMELSTTGTAIASDAGVGATYQSKGLGATIRAVK